MIRQRKYLVQKINSNSNKVIHVLVLTDSFELLREIKTLLSVDDVRGEAYHIVYSNSLNGSLRHLVQNRFDAVLLSVDIPKLGIEVSELIARAAVGGCTMPMILIVDYITKEHIQTVKDLGAIDIISQYDDLLCKHASHTLKRVIKCAMKQGGRIQEMKDTLEELSRRVQDLVNELRGHKK